MNTTSISRLCVLGCVALLLAVPISSAFILDKDKEVVLADHPDYRVLFHETGSVKETAGMKKKKPIKWKEVGYKITIKSEEKLANLFNQGAIKVRLLDSDGFSLGDDILRQENLDIALQYYGFIWIPAKTVKKIHSADIKKVRLEELTKQENRRAAEAAASAPDSEPQKASQPESGSEQVSQSVESTPQVQVAKPAAPVPANAPVPAAPKVETQQTDVPAEMQTESKAEKEEGPPSETAALLVEKQARSKAELKGLLSQNTFTDEDIRRIMQASGGGGGSSSS